MDLITLCKKINLQEEIFNKVIQFNQSFNFQSIQQELINLNNKEISYNTYEKLTKLFNEDSYNIAILTSYLNAALLTYEIYKQKGIKESVFIDTMKCFTRFIEECKVKTDKYAFDRAWWTHKQVSMVIFRLGQLEYEFINEDKKIISIHIPSDANMTKENLLLSLEMLKEFVNNHYQEYKNALVLCDTWLLAPKLKEFLNNNSKILNFQNLFDIVYVDENSDDCFEWVFKKNRGYDINNVCVKTSLQQKVKQLMLDNKHLGKATGYLKDEFL